MSVQALRRAARRRGGTPAATIAYRAGVVPTIGNTTGPFTVTVPGTVAAGDLMVLAVSWTTATGATSVPDPAGWTLLTPPGQIDDEAQLSLRVWTRVATGSDASSTVSLTFGAVVKACLGLEVYSGAGRVVTATSAVTNDTATTSHVTPTAGVTSDGCWYAEIVADKAATATTWTQPAGRTLRHQNVNSGAGPSSLAMADSNAAVAQGTVGNGTWTASVSSSRAVMFTLVLEPGVGTQPPPATIAYRAGATPAAGNTTSFSVTIPSAAQLGDFCVLAIGWGWNSTVTTIPTPVGFTPLSIGQQDDESNLSTLVWTKTVAAGDPGRVITITTAATIKATLLCEVYSGTSGLAAAAAQIEGATATTSHSTATLTNATAGAWLVSIMFDRNGATLTWTIPGSQTLRHPAYTTGSAAVTAAITDSNAIVATGNVGGLVFTSDGTATSRAVGYSLLLAPGGGGSGNPNQGKVVFGMFNATSRPGSGDPDGQAAGGGFANAGDTALNWRHIADDYMTAGRMHVRRCFNSGLPSTDNTGNAAQGITSGFSVKTSIATAATGGANSAFTTLANAMPDGSYLILYHEPEDDAAGGAFTPEQWVAAQQNFYTSCKNANDTLIVGPSHMAFQWGQAITQNNPDRWRIPDGYKDFLGVDAYAMEFTSGYTNMNQDTRFMNWHNWAKDQGVPLAFTELACVRKYETGYNDSSVPWPFTTPYSDAQAATFITNTVTWAVANGYRMIWYWNAWHADFAGAGHHSSGPGDPDNPWHFRDEQMNPTNSEPMTSPLMLAAWNNMLTTYGSTSPNLFDTV